MGEKVKTQGASLPLLDFWLLPCFAIAFYRLVFWSTTSGSFIPADEFLNFIEMAAQALVMIALIVLDYRINYTERTVACFIAIAAVIQLFGSGFIFAPYYIEGFSSQFIVFLGAFLRGAGSAVLLLALGRYLCSIEPKRSALIIAGGYTIFGVTSFLLSFTSHDVIAFAALVFPIASGFCLLWSNEKIAIAPPDKQLPNKKILRKIPLDTVILLFLCALAGVISGAFSSSSNLINSRAFNMLWMIIYLVVFLAYCVWVFYFKRDDPDALWPFLVLIIFSGLFAYSAFSTINLELATNFMSATRRTLMLFCWVFMAASIYREKLPILLVFGVGNLVFSQVPVMISYLIGIFNPQLDTYEASLVNIGTTAVMALVLVVAIIVVIMKNRAPHNSALEESGMPDATTSAIDIVAEENALSPRESEIALLIVKGYTLPMIGEKLFISTDTVRSHSKNLYKKLGIHKKQELIMLVEEYIKR